MMVYFRISDKGNPKEKIPNAGKRECLLNAIAEFGVECVYVIADNCEPATVDFIRAQGLPYEETALGNAASFMYSVNLILKRHSLSETVYLLEDDYLHLPGSKVLLNEGLEIADYVTLYDHPDKYVLENEGGNPFNHQVLNTTRLYVTRHSHWRDTDSTTMTFACKVVTLSEDFPIWQKNAQSGNPDDFHSFMEITQNKFSHALSFLFRRKKQEFSIIILNWARRKKVKRLISAIPSRATHAEVKSLAPVLDWYKI